MSHSDAGPLSNYNSLLDKNLSGYFGNTKMKKHLVKSGLITKSGHITSENAYRLKMAKKEHRKHVRDILANAIVEKALDMERMRQHEIRKRLDELYKIELVQKVRSERSEKSNQELIALLSPRSKKSTKHRKAKSAVVRGEDRSTRLPDIYFDEKSKKLYYDTNDSLYSDSVISDRHQHFPEQRPKKPRSSTAKAFTPHPPATKKKKKRKVHRGLILAKSDQLIAHRVQIQSMAEVTMKFLGSPLNLTNDMFPSGKLSEVQVIQQHCGASTVCVFRELLPANTVFTFVSRRHRGSPFGLTIYINGIINIRVSSCCEYKHKPGNKIGGKNSQFALISVQGAAPCYRCQVRLNMNEDKNKEEDKEDKEEDTSSDEEEAVRSYDIIVSRGGKREDEGEEETKQKERPVSAHATTQTGEDENIDENDAEYQDDDFEEEEEEEEKEFDLKEDPRSSSESSDSDSADELDGEKIEKVKNVDTGSSSGGSSSEDEEEGKEEEATKEKVEERKIQSEDASDRDEDKKVDSDVDEKDDSEEDDSSDKPEEKPDSTDDVSSEAEKSTEVEETTEQSDNAKEGEDTASHVYLDDAAKDDSHSDSDSSTSSKSSRSSKSSDSDSDDDKPKDVDEDKNDANVGNNEESSSEKSEAKAAEVENEIESTSNKKEEHEHNEDSPEVVVEHSDVKHDDENNEDEDENADEKNDSLPSVISRESTMLTGNEDGECENENKTIQFNEEVDVVHYEKVDVEPTPESTPRSDVSDSDEDFDAMQHISQKIMLTDLGDDDDDDDDEEDADIDVDKIEQKNVDEGITE